VSATTRHLTVTVTVLLALLLALLVAPAPAHADKGFDATCDGVEITLGSGTGLRSAKKDLAGNRGRWGTATGATPDPGMSSSATTFLPVSWTITVEDTVTGETPVVDLPLLTSNGHRHQTTVTCTFVSLLPPSPPEFPNAGLATHTLVVVPRPAG
jgi:hypothetical protein